VKNLANESPQIAAYWTYSSNRLLLGRGGQQAAMRISNQLWCDLLPLLGKGDDGNNGVQSQGGM